jgi:quinol monooxygenase YgiN
VASGVLSLDGVIRLSVCIVARPGEAGGLAAALRLVKTQALAQPGCADAHLSADLTNPDVLHYREDWVSEADFREEVRSERFKRLIRIIEASAEPPRLEVQLVSNTQGIEYVEQLIGGTAG